MVIDKKKKIFLLFFFTLTLLTFFMMYCFMPLDKMNPGHDMLFHHRRFVALMEALRNGNFPIYLDFGAFDNYGYGTKWFYSDFILIPFATIANLTSFVLGYKTLWLVMTLLCGLFSYQMMNRIYKNQLAASYSALIYTFASYRLQDVYERAALGEALAFTFIPLVFWGLYEIIKGNYKKWYLISIGFSLLIFSHLLSTVITFITILIFIVIYYKDFIKKPVRLLYLVFAGCITLLLSGYFLFPFAEQMLHSTFQISSMEYKGGEEFTILEFLRSITYPHAIFKKEEAEIFLGISMILCIVLRFFVKDKSKYIKSIDICVLIGLAYLLLTSNIFDWSIYPLKVLNFIQFPWRLFVFCTFFFSMAGGYYLANIAIEKNRIVVLGSILIVLIAGQMITQSLRYKVINNYYTALTFELEMTMELHQWFFVTQEYFPNNLNVDIIYDKLDKIDKIDKQNSSTQISNIERNDGFISCDIETSGNEQIEFPLTYYKGYTAKLNNEPLEVREGQCGLVEVPINDSGKLVVQFTGTFIQRYSLYVSLMSFIILGIYIILYNRRNEIK